MRLDGGTEEASPHEPAASRHDEPVRRRRRRCGQRSTGDEARVVHGNAKPFGRVEGVLEAGEARVGVDQDGI